MFKIDLDSHDTGLWPRLPHSPEAGIAANIEQSPGTQNLTGVPENPAILYFVRFKKILCKFAE